MPPTQPPTNPDAQRRRATQTLRLALLFTLAMLALSFVLWRFGQPDDAPAKLSIWVRTQAVGGVAGEPVTLRAQVVDQSDSPVAGFALLFSERDVIGRATTDASGDAAVQATFDQPGAHTVDIRPDATEKRDFRMLAPGAIRVTIHPRAVP